jgi:hypothetical protein
MWIVGPESFSTPSLFSAISLNTIIHEVYCMVKCKILDEISANGSSLNLQFFFTIWEEDASPISVYLLVEAVRINYLPLSLQLSICIYSVFDLLPLARNLHVVSCRR